MRISQWTGTLGAAAAIALLAGCSGGSQYAPSATGGTGAGTGPSTMSTLHGATRTAPLFASRQAQDFFNHRPIVNLERGRVIVDPAAAKCKAKRKGLVFASSNITEDLLVYCGPGKLKVPSGEKAFKTLTGVAGWGIAVHGTQLAVGQTGGNINIYSLPALTLQKTLTLPHAASGFNAYGLAYDPSGGLYATEWPGGFVDYWKTPVSGGSPNCSVSTTTNTEDYYVAAHGSNSVVVYGADANSTDFSVNTEGITNMPSCSGMTDALIQNFGALDAATGFPGGEVSTASGTLYVNNQYGTLYNVGTYPGGAVSSSCSWGFNPNDVTNISMASNQNSIWGSNINFGGATLETYLESFAAGSLSGTCATGAAGGPTAQNANDEFLGVAAFKNAGN
jgi:hypothetical protein